jgi:hypothetical protein
LSIAESPFELSKQREPTGTYKWDQIDSGSVPDPDSPNVAYWHV